MSDRSNDYLLHNLDFLRKSERRLAEAESIGQEPVRSRRLIKLAMQETAERLKHCPHNQTITTAIIADDQAGYDEDTWQERCINCNKLISTEAPSDGDRALWERK